MIATATDAKLHAWWWRKQGLDGSLAAKAPAQVLAHAGWARSVGGVGSYLTLYARAGIGRERADAAVAAHEIAELPSARGCTYVLPAEDFALGLTVGGGNNGDLRTAEKLGALPGEIDALGASVVAALERGPLDPDGLRDVLGDIPTNGRLDQQRYRYARWEPNPLANGPTRSDADARSFSLDSPKSRAPRIAALRAERPMIF